MVTHHRTLSRGRRRAMVGVAAALVAATAVPAAAVTEIDDSSLVGLHGTQDPTYDGAFRQSLTLIAQVAAGETPDPTAVGWLLDQQCPDGGFMGLRIDEACTPDPALYTGEDSNATALAATALHAVGEDAAAADALAALAGWQVPSGGFEFQTGFGADPNSTGLAIAALNSLGQDPQTFNGRDAVSGLAAMQADCSADPLDVGGFVAPFSGQADLLATVQALPAAAGSALPVAPPATFDATVTDIVCPGAFTDPAAAAADWLESQPLSAFAAVDQRAFAVLGFAAVGAGETRAREIFDAMTADAATALLDGDGALRPGAAALYILAALALGEDPGFGDLDLLGALAESRLAASPASTTSPAPPSGTVPESTPDAELAESGAATATLALVGLLLTLAGGALLAVGRRFRTR